MPANLPPQYFETERKLKSAKSPQEKIKILEELLAIVPKHKGTEKLQALLKTKIAKLRSLSQKRPEISRQTPIYHIEKKGAGQVVLIGPPNAGKSSLVKSLTNANPEIGDYPFTTRFPYPAMMKYENIQIQLVDSPPITSDYMETWHSELIKMADGVLLILDLSSANQAEAFHIILEKLSQKKIELIFGNQPLLGGEKFQKKSLLVANKSDTINASENLLLLKSTLGTKFPLLALSAKSGEGLEELKKKTFEMIDIIRVYSKVPGKKVDFNEPFVFKKGSTLLDMARAVHKDFAEKLKYARLWNRDKFQGQKVNKNYVLEDEDVIELHL